MQRSGIAPVKHPSRAQTDCCPVRSIKHRSTANPQADYAALFPDGNTVRAQACESVAQKNAKYEEYGNGCYFAVRLLTTLLVLYKISV